MIREILVLHHSHLDVGYTHAQPVVWELQTEFVGAAVDWLEQTADIPEQHRPKWTCEATEPVQRWIEAAAPEDVARLRTLVKQGRLGLSALRWHVDAGIDASGLRRLVDGKRRLEHLLETQVRVACQHDVNGVPWPIVDVLLQADVELLVMAINPHLGRAAGPRPGLFRWEGPTGDAIRVFNGSAYTMFDQIFSVWENSVERMVDGWRAFEERLVASDYPLPFVYLTSTCSPVLWDNGPPNPFLPSLIQQWNERSAGPPIRYATFDDLFERVVTVPEDELPLLRGDWTDYWSFGVGSVPVATARSRRAKALIDAAGSIRGPLPHPALARATEHVDLFDEHTFGFWDTGDDHPQAQTIELLKEALAHEGYELAAFALMDGLERLSGNRVADRGVAGVLICNPGPNAVVLHPLIPAAWRSQGESGETRTYRANRMAYEGRSWEPGFLDGGITRCGPVELAPGSWRVIPLDQLEAAPSSVVHRPPEPSTGVSAVGFVSVGGSDLERVAAIESDRYCLEYDEHSGRILALRDRMQERDVLRARPGLDVFAYVRERADPLDDGARTAFYRRDLEQEKLDVSCWRPWHPVHEGATSVVSCEVRETPVGITLERRLDAPGASHCVQRITLSDEAIVRFDVELELIPDPAPQSVYFALPVVASEGWRALYDTAGCAVELDADQLPGACRNWVTVESFAAIGDDDGAFALLCADAPLVQFGGFHFGPPLEEVPRDRDPLLLAWPVNNYWDTNFPRVQHGRIRLSYGLLSVGSLDESVIRRGAAEFRQPALVWPVVGGSIQARSGTLGIRPCACSV